MSARKTPDMRQTTLVFPTLPYVKTSDTSHAAAESMRPHAGAIRERVFARIVAAGMAGITCDGLEEALGLTHQSCSARVNELHNAGRIADSGRRARTRSGRHAALYIGGPKP